MHRYFKRVVSGVASSNYIYFWKSKGLSDENIAAPNTSDYSLNPQLSYLGTKTKVEIKGSCLKQDKITYTLKKNSKHLHCTYFGQRIGFDGHGSYSHLSGGNRRNVITFGVDMNSSIKIDNWKKNILILGMGPRIRTHTICRKNVFN